MYVLEAIYYEIHEYDYGKVLAVSDTKEKLMQYAVTISSILANYGPEWETKEDGALSVVLIQELDGKDIYSKYGLRISHVRLV